MPTRIQRKRTKGWRMPEGAVYVGRPSKWGNPFKVMPYGQWGPGESWAIPGTYWDGRVNSDAVDRAVRSFRSWVLRLDIHEMRGCRPSQRSIELLNPIGEWDLPLTRSSFTHNTGLLVRFGAPYLLDDLRAALAGKDLTCWCPLDAPCHADVLLEFAND